MPLCRHHHRRRHHHCLSLLAILTTTILTTTTTTTSAQPAFSVLNVTEPPCNVANDGTTDVTQALRACIDRAASFMPPLPLFFPTGTYLVSDTITVEQHNPGPDDGINVCPGRFLPFVLFGSTAALPRRPLIKLAANSAGFNDPHSPKPVLRVYSADGEGVDMNNMVRGLNIDLTGEGLAGAIGVSHPGAQGATVTDVTVFGGGAFACFAGVNGAGGAHSNVACVGARYGIYVDDSQPVGVVVGASLINQTVSAIYHVSGQEMLSVVGSVIVQAADATGPALEATDGTFRGFSVVDSRISCAGLTQGASTAVRAQLTIYLQDVYVSNSCATAISQASHPAIPGPGAEHLWLHIHQFARGVDPRSYYHSNVIYVGGQRRDNTSVYNISFDDPPADLQSRHLWDELSFPSMERVGTANAKLDCGAAGDNVTDDTRALQACIDSHSDIYFPPGRYRISNTLQLRPGSRLIGTGNVASTIAVATGGFPAATLSQPLPMIATSGDDGKASATIVAFLGLTTFQHVPNVYTMLWQSQTPDSIWRANYESRDCECLWTSSWQHLSPTDIACQLPVNISIAKSQFRGVGKIYSFVNDDTGAIISTGAKYRHLLVADNKAFAGPDAKLRFYSLNLEHAQSEVNAEISNASYVDIYSIKSEGNLPILWIRGGSTNINMLAFGGGVCPFAMNFSFPPDFEQWPPSLFRIDSGSVNVTLAAVQDHAYGVGPPYWPPQGGDCKWTHHYPYPGQRVAEFPYWTFPNVTMWNCWYGNRPAIQYQYAIVDRSQGGEPTHTTPMDKPVLYVVGE